MLPWLRGRTVKEEVKDAAVRAREALLLLPAATDPSWHSEIREGAAALGLTVREFASVVGVECEVPDVRRPKADPRPHPEQWWKRLW